MAREKKQGPKGGIKHTPGRGHARKSEGHKTRRYRRKAQKERQAWLEELRRQWRVWDSLPPDVRRIRYDLKPIAPRPSDET